MILYYRVLVGGNIMGIYDDRVLKSFTISTTDVTQEKKETIYNIDL